MQRLGLSDAELRAYHRTLVTPGHRRRIIVDVYTLDGDLRASLTPDFVDGQVMVDATQGAEQPTRILDLSFTDPTRSIHFEPNAPGEAPLHRSRIVQVTDARRVEELGEWVECEVFTGPIWDFDRLGALVTIVGHGLERQGLGQKWTPRTFRKRTKKTDAIRDLLYDTGERRLGGIPDLGARMPERLTVTRMDSPWPRAVRLAASMDRQLFYPGHGRPILRRIPSKPVFTFDGRHLVSEITIDRGDPQGSSGFHNTFVVVGTKSKGAKKRPQAVRSLPPGHPLSAQSLARNGEPHRLVKREELRQVKTQAEAAARAERMRDAALRTLVSYSFDSVPIPHLDEEDLVRVRTEDDGSFTVRLRQFSIPLGYEGAPPMTIGAIRRTKRNGRKRD